LLGEDRLRDRLGRVRGGMGATLPWPARGWSGRRCRASERRGRWPRRYANNTQSLRK